VAYVSQFRIVFPFSELSFLTNNLWSGTHYSHFTDDIFQQWVADRLMYVSRGFPQSSRKLPKHSMRHVALLSVVLNSIIIYLFLSFDMQSSDRHYIFQSDN